MKRHVEPELHRIPSRKDITQNTGSRDVLDREPPDDYRRVLEAIDRSRRQLHWHE